MRLSTELTQAPSSARLSGPRSLARSCGGEDAAGFAAVMITCGVTTQAIMRTAFDCASWSAASSWSCSTS
jgi:hypothetical protein